MNKRSSICTLKGVGEKMQEKLNRVGVETIEDLLHFYPKGYEIFEAPIPISEAVEGRIHTITGAVFGRIQVGGNAKMQITTLYLKDLTGTIRVIWYRMPFLRSTLGKGGSITLRGRVTWKRGERVMEHPEIYYPSEKYEEKQNTMQPVYPLTAGLTNNAVIRFMQQALAYADDSLDTLPQYLVREMQFQSFFSSLRNMHFPESKESFIAARQRFVFEEFLIFVLSLRRLKGAKDRAGNPFLIQDHPQIETFLAQLPYELTRAQKKVWNEIRQDLQGEAVMSRLVQGDVGSGKTVIAFLSLLLVGLNGYQGALMAPTEVLARQHYATISGFLQTYHLPLEAELLTGSMTAAQKRKAYARIKSGEASIVIGTHALIQDKVQYNHLALVITDEQHRFGVRQRELLSEKGSSPHILVMSATPIPRTLAIILYGDLDISVIDEMPANRLPIKNCVVDTGYRKTAYQFMKKQVGNGRQCYVICPMVEESESMEAENVIDYAEMLADELGSEIKVGFLHGKMKQKEKDQIMEAFAGNQIQVLVSTTVIEVGIDVPNAVVMLIENAERFGLAQLHQLRGRVGRGAHQSYCIFMSGSKKQETKERLEILNHSNDGFYIAGEDLRLRGPGDLFGIRQSGVLDFQLADVFQDASMLQKAAEAAEQILQMDPELKRPEHAALRRRIDSRLDRMMLETTL